MRRFAVRALRRAVPWWIGVMALCVPVPAASQDAAFNTTELVNAANRLTAADLPRLRARADAGDPRSQVLLGLAYEMGGAGLEPQPREALPWFLKAAGQGIAWAEVWAGDFYFNGGPGLERNFEKALALYTSAAEHGDAKAAFLVGQMFLYGDGVPANRREAAAWLRRAVSAAPEIVEPMIELAEAGCESAFCVSLRQVIAAIVSDGAGRFIDSWDDASHEWESTVTLPDAERCGLTSSDRTSLGGVRNYFCDSAVIADETRGAAVAQQTADLVAATLPEGYVRRERSDLKPGPSIFFARDGFPNVRVTYNVTPGSAQHRVTLLVGP